MVKVGDHVESVLWDNNQSGQTKKHKISCVLDITGAHPNSRLLECCSSIDRKGFIKMGTDLSPENLSAAGWPIAHLPYLLETRLSTVFPVDYLCGSSIKPFVCAAGEGSIMISFVHKVLQE